MLFMNCQQAITASIDNINYWLSKKKADGLFHIDNCDIFILNVARVNSPYELINIESENIEYLTDKMEDMRRFFEPDKEIRKIF